VVRNMSSVGLVLRLFTAVVLIVAAVLARGAPTAFVILLVLGISSLVLTVMRYRGRRGGQR